MTEKKRSYAVGQNCVPREGPFLTIILSLSGETIIDAKFQSCPCSAASACGDSVTNWAEDKKQSDIPGLTEEILLASTGPMPLGREHCPKLAHGSMFEEALRHQPNFEPSRLALSEMTRLGSHAL